MTTRSKPRSAGTRPPGAAAGPDGMPKNPAKWARSWIYWVLNPLAAGYRRENSLLTRGYTSWQFYKQDFEYIGCFSLYLQPEGIEALEDPTFRRQPRHHPLLDGINAHDESIVDLRTRANETFDHLRLDDTFLAAVGEALAAHRAGGHTDSVAGAYGEDRLPDLVAQRLINRVEVLTPGFEADAVFWTNQRERFKRFQSGAAFQRLNKSIEATRTDAVRLWNLLVALRTEYSEAYGLPPVPAPSDQ